MQLTPEKLLTINAQHAATNLLRVRLSWQLAHFLLSLVKALLAAQMIMADVSPTT